MRSRFLSPGYWRDPDRTAAVFFDVSDQSGERLYRTGDVGRMRPDGCLEHLGRKDFRVKIRGFRVELEEIERSLCAHPLVLEAAVIARPDRSGVNLLAAYVVSRAGQPPTADDLRAHLRSTLPEQMVPALFGFLPGLPRVANGKVDRGALREPARQETGDRAPVHARTGVEETLAAIWREVLEIPSVDVHDDFFELGGDSLRAGQVASRISHSLHIDIPLRTLMEAPTIVQVADVIEHHFEQAKRVRLDRIAGLLTKIEDQPGDDVLQTDGRNVD